MDRFIIDYLELNDEQIPRTEDGRFAFIEYADEKYFVNEDENFLAGVIGTMGFDEFADEYERTRLFADLGVSSSSNFIEDVMDYFPKDAESKARDSFGEEPWTRDEFPEAYVWLQKNDSLIDKLADAARRPKAYQPIKRRGPDDLFFSVLFYGFTQTRDAARNLSYRGKNHVGNQNIEAAIDDLVSIGKIGAKTQLTDTLIHRLVGLGIVDIGFDLFQDILGDQHLAVEHIDKLNRQYFNDEPASLLGPIRNLELFGLLDTIQYLEKGVDRDTLGIGDENFFGPDVTLNDFQYNVLFSKYTNWEVAAKQASIWNERLQQICQIKNDRQRLVEFRNLTDQLEELNHALSGFGANFRLLAGARSRGCVAGEILAAMTFGNIAMVENANIRQKIQRDLKSVALAIEKYHLKNGTYPSKLTDLRPQYIQAIPVDRYSGKPLVYRLTSDNYLVCSCGSDEISQLETYLVDQPENDFEKSDDVVLKVDLKK